MNPTSAQGTRGLAYSTDGRSVFSVSGDSDQNGVLQRWNLQTRQATLLAKLPATPVQLTLASDGGRICVALEQSAMVFAADSGELVYDWAFPGVRVVRLRPLEDDGLFVACTRDGRVHVLAPELPQDVFTMKVEGQNVFDALPVGKRLITCSQKGAKAAAVWDVSVRSPIVYPVVAERLPQEARGNHQWTDASGLFQLTASLQEATAGEVLLLPAEGGAPLRIARSKLSSDDRRLLADWVANAAAPVDRGVEGSDPSAGDAPPTSNKATETASTPTREHEEADEGDLKYWPLGEDYEMAPLSPVSAGAGRVQLGAPNRWRIRDATATADGWVWLATSEGLAMIRGNQATAVRGPRFSDDSVLAVCPHPAGGVAVSLAARGVVRLAADPQAEVEELGFPASAPDADVAAAAPTLLTMDALQRLWAAGGFPGAAWLAPDGWRLHQPKAGSLQPKALWLQAHDDGVLAWLEGGAGLYEADAKGMDRVKWPYHNGVTCVGLHGDGKLAVFTIQDPTQTGFVMMKSRFAAVVQKQLSPNVRVLSAAPDAKGGVWVGSDQGLGRWENNRFEFWNQPFRGEPLDWMRPLAAGSILVGSSALGRYYVVRSKQS